MKKIVIYTLLTFIIGLYFATIVVAQNNNPWISVDEVSISKSNSVRQIVPSKYQTFQLDNIGLRSILANAKMRFTAEAFTAAVTLKLPMPDGSVQEFEIVEAPVMHPQLQAKFPNMRSFAGKGVDDPTAYLRFSITPKGFNGMIISAKNNTVYIDPYAKGDTQNYISYYKKDYTPNQSHQFACGVEIPKANFLKDIDTETFEQNSNNTSFIAGDCQLRTYRLALACTGEYADFHGGNVPAVMAEFVVAMTRVNGVYENDVTVTMEMVPNNDELIFLDGATDPYTNNSGGTMLNENQTTCDNIIGSANYDIGHVFSTGGGGIAQLNAPCGGGKARGVTGLPSPIGDPFYIDYVSHEMGHQFGANHTQNNSCNRNNATAMEPGSASTIMGYAGICAPNVQNNSDDHFHAISIQEITNYIENGNGNSCPVKTSTGNNNPTASVASGFYNLPVSTPFALTCIASDPDGDVLTYNWEQMDNEVATMPPLPTNTGGPAFRSNSSVESPTRYFPNLNAIINGTTPTWEVLPSVSRDMSFRCTVRDNFAGAGCRDEVDVDLSFTSSAGPFLVMNPNTNLTWFAGAVETVLWDVANTDAAPVSCSNVDILLSVDGGNTYNFTLATNVPNTGSFNVSVPNVPNNTSRVKVVCSDNIFFDISDQNFTIETPPNPTFLLNVLPASQSSCNTEELIYDIDLTSILGFDEEITLSVDGLPGDATATFDTNPVIPPANVQLTIGNLSEVASGTYILTVNAVAASLSLSFEVEMTLTDGVPDLVVLNNPADGETSVEVMASLQWEALSSATNYFIEIATCPSFGDSIVETSSTQTNFYQAQNLEELTVYYWRVKGENICGEGEFSNTFAFQTLISSCTTYESDDVPVTIEGNEANTVTSLLNINDDFEIVDAKVDLFIQHTYVGDLIADLTSPSGTNIALFDRPGVPNSTFGCSGNDILAQFDDDAPNTAQDFEEACESNVPTISGEYQSIDLLSNLNGESGAGEWTLTVEDVFAQDGGAINFWSIELCGSAISPELPNLITNQVLTVLEGDNELITSEFLEANSAGNTPDQIIFKILSLPENGTLFKDNGGTLTALNLGEQFSQQDINNNLLSYTHDGSNTLTDSFDFDVFNNENGWLHNSTFNINIVEDDLSASATLDIEIDCFDANNAQVTVNTVGGTGPFEYSLDGINFQSENLFENLASGTYTFTVKDANNLTTTTNEIVIDNPAELTISANVIDDDITITAGGGTGTLTYSIDGVNYQSSNIFNDLPNGIYTVYVMDENGCIQETEAIIAVNTMIVSATLANDITCFNDNNASIEVGVGGGTAPFNYSLNGGSFQSSNVFENLGPGNYTVTVMDDGGFTAETNEIIISNPPELTIDVDVLNDDITVNASGGTGDLMYSIDGVNYQSSNVFNDLVNGVYTIYVIDENGCIVETEATVAVNSLVVSAFLINDLDCYNDMDGSIEVSVQGGTPNFTYSLNGGSFQSSNIFSGLGAGNYTITVMDNDGFTAETNEVIINNPLEIIGIVNAVDDDIVVDASGGTGDLMYSLDGINYQSSNEFLDLPTGDYTLYIKDENDCIVEVEFSITVNTLVVSANLTNDIDCHNDADGVIEVSVEGGTPNFTYSINGSPFQSSNIFSNLGAGTYTVVVQDANGFAAETNMITIENPEALTGLPSVNGYDITVNASGGTGDLEYSLNGGPFQSSNVFPGNTNGDYTITVMDENGCQIEVSATVSVDALSVFTTHHGLSCYNLNDGVIVIAAFGGVPPYQYSIDGVNFQDENGFDGLSPGIYTVTVMDSGGFTIDADPIVITSPTELILDVVEDMNNITLNGSGGVPPYLYSIDGISFGDENVFEDLDDGEYPCTIQDANGCESTILVTIGISNTRNLDFDLEMLVQPNPSSGNFIISIKQKETTDLKFKVFDVTGKLVFFEEINSAGIEFKKDLNLTHLAGGTYHLVVSSDLQIGVKKLVVLK